MDTKILILVCSTWRAVSQSNLLWQNLTRLIWRASNLSHNSWHEQYIYLHRTAHNFRISRYTHTTLNILPANDINNNNSLSCRRLAVSDHHIAAGFSDGSIRLFHLSNGLHLSTFRPQHRDRLGQFSPAVSGIVLCGTRIVFASLDGDIHVAAIDNDDPPRRAHLGDVVNDGALLDFHGCNRWWVGLYAGVPGRAFHVWNSSTEELVFRGGTLTDPEAVTGWRSLTEFTGLIGQVRVTRQELAVACTSHRVIVFDLRNHFRVLGEQEFPRGLVMTAFAASHEAFVILDGYRFANVHRVDNLERVCGFNVLDTCHRGRTLGCMNGGYVMMCALGVIRAWDVEQGLYLYSLGERIGQASVLVADERYVAACSDATIHLWDFGVQ